MSRPPMNLIFPDRSAAGISSNQDGQRVIASTRRPDGTFRPEIKVRPGYTPQEDVSLFRSTKQKELDQHKATKGTIPGLKPNAMVQDALRGAQGGGGGGGGGGMSRSQKKNMKRKEKETEEVKDSWDAEQEEEESKSKATEKDSKLPPPVPSATEATTTSTEDPAKRLRNLKKKLKQTQQLKEKEEGGASLGDAEKEKVNKMSELVDEIAKLEIS